MFSRIWTKKSTPDCSEQIKRLQTALSEADTVLIGAGAGLSASAGFTYDGERFKQKFSDFAQKYGIQDTIEAALTHKREHIYHAAMLDPHTAAELSIPDIIALCDEMIESNAGWIGEYR